MNPTELYHALSDASGLSDAFDAIQEFERSNPTASWVPVGGRQNNRGVIEVAVDPGRSLVERVTNAIDAVLELQHQQHDGRPQCRTPREAASAWLNVPDTGLASLTLRERHRLADYVNVVVGAGDNRSARLLEIRDYGIGLTPEMMPGTILSLNESNKMTKHYLAGAYGQGGSSTFAVSAATLIASRRNDGDPVGFTVVRFRDLPPEEYKVGHYVYLVLTGSVLRAEFEPDKFRRGTQVKHFAYDLTNYNNSRGPSSVYGLLNQVLFDPVLPIWLDNHLANYRRTIIGSRSGLNGAAEESDEAQDVAHLVPMFFVSLGELGRIGIEYWVLPAPTATNKTPTAAYVNPRRPIVLSLNGQNQAELSQILIRKEAELPYLAQRLVCHVDCDFLSPASLRALFTSNREDARRGVLLDRIKEELVRVLKSDDDLTRLNTEARDRGHRERDEVAVLEARRAVARLLRLQGLNVTDALGGVTATVPETVDRPSHPRPSRRHVAPAALELHEPPTYIRMVWEDDRPLMFYPEQRRYIRIETDAASHYHTPNNAAQSRINIIVSDGEVVVRGSTPLRGGRMRAIFDCIVGARVGGTGMLRVELSAPGLSVLSDERAFSVVATPPAREDRREITLPPFDIRPLGPDDEKWIALGWPDDVARIASATETDEGEMVVYYNTAFPKYAAQYATFERRDVARANSFKTRYEIWLVVHSLLLEQSSRAANFSSSVSEAHPEQDDSAIERAEIAERIRMASIAVMFASKEAQMSEAATTDSE